MAVANRILNIIILVMALIAVVFGWKLSARRKELRERGNVFAQAISNTAQKLDVNSPEPIAEDLMATEKGAKGKLGWEAFHEDFVAGGSQMRAKMTAFEEHAEKIRGQRDDLSKYIAKVADQFEHPELKMAELNDPKKSGEQLDELYTYLGKYHKRDADLTAALKDIHGQLTKSNLDLQELKDAVKYTEAVQQVKQEITRLQEMNDRYSNALSQAVTKLGGEDRLGVTPQRIREVNPADVESMIKGIERIMDTVAEVENLRVQIKAVEEQLAKAKDDLDRANEEIAKHLIKIDSLKKVNEGQVIKIAKLQGIINSMTGKGTGPAGTVGRHFDGKVKKVNYDYNYIVIDIGGKDKIVFGTQLTVARDREFICNVVVTKVYKDYAVAEIMPENKQGEVIEGDRVVALE